MSNSIGYSLGAMIKQAYGGSEPVENDNSWVEDYPGDDPYLPPAYFDEQSNMERDYFDPFWYARDITSVDDLIRAMQIAQDTAKSQGGSILFYNNAMDRAYKGKKLIKRLLEDIKKAGPGYDVQDISSLPNYPVAYEYRYGKAGRPQDQSQHPLWAALGSLQRNDDISLYEMDAQVQGAPDSVKSQLGL